MFEKSMIGRDFEYWQYSNLLDISLTEYFVLLELYGNSSPTPRKLIMDLLIKKFNDPNTIHPSSYYKRLERLEKKGLVTYVDTSSRRNQTIAITDFGRKFLRQMFVFSILSLVDLDSTTPELIPLVMKRLKKHHFNKLLVINMEVGITPNSINLLTNLSEQTFLLTTEWEYDLYIKGGLDKSIARTDLLDGRIREANDTYDGVIIIGYDCDFGSFEKQFDDLFHEGLRVLQEGAPFLVVTNQEIEDSENIVMSTIKNVLLKSYAIGNETPQSVEEKLESYKLKDIGSITHLGVIVAWGYKP